MAFLVQTTAKARTKLACIGNSITYGLTLADPARESYPSQLQLMLGDRYEVGNFGKSGATLLRKGHRPYMQQEEYRRAMAFKPDIAVIHLGVNDTDPRDWPDYRDEFVADYLALIDSVRASNPRCRILIARLTPITWQHPRFESGTRDWEKEIQEAIATVARVARVQLIDFHSPLYSYPFLQPDAIHPNAGGARLLAETVYSAVTGNYGGLALPSIYTDGMVLQRDRPLDICGTANAGERVTLTIAGKRYSTVCGDNGKWKVTVSPLETGQAYTMTVESKSGKIALRDILAGEVWLCSGQSNMAFALNACSTASSDIPLADNGNIRIFDMQPRWQTNAVKWPVEIMDSINRLQYFHPAAWAKCTPETAAPMSAVAYYFGKMLQDSLKVPVGLICNAVGGAPTEAWIDRETTEECFPAILRDWEKNDFVQPWVRQRAALNIELSQVKGQRHPYNPCYLFESGILPLAQFPIKGVIWYQGESNAHNKDAHAKLFKMLADSWRNYWNDDTLPIYYVQLSSLNRPSWPWFRDSQRLLQDAVPHVAMAVSSDVGDSTDVHFRNKRPVGMRLARFALNKSYGRTDITPCGPSIRKATVSGGYVWLDFDESAGMRSSDGKPLRTFEVAAEEGLYREVTAEVVGSRLRLDCRGIENPRFVRYAWQPFTRANLVNEAGLPASTFRVEIANAR